MKIVIYTSCYDISDEGIYPSITTHFSSSVLFIHTVVSVTEYIIPSTRIMYSPQVISHLKATYINYTTSEEEGYLFSVLFLLLLGAIYCADHPSLPR
jgi:hypothetical protein